jgi:hypothetical protein
MWRPSYELQPRITREIFGVHEPSDELTSRSVHALRTADRTPEAKGKLGGLTQSLWSTLFLLKQLLEICVT